MTQHRRTPWTWPMVTCLIGLGVAVVGILLQLAGDPGLFGGFPPGIYFLVGAAVLVMLTRRWWWAPAFAVLLAAWVTFGGLAGGQLARNLTSGNALVATGAVVLQVGLAAAILAGVWAMVRNLKG